MALDCGKSIDAVTFEGRDVIITLNTGRSATWTIGAPDDNEAMKTIMMEIMSWAGKSFIHTSSQFGQNLKDYAKIFLGNAHCDLNLYQNLSKETIWNTKNYIPQCATDHKIIKVGSVLRFHMEKEEFQQRLGDILPGAADEVEKEWMNHSSIVKILELVRIILAKQQWAIVFKNDIGGTQIVEGFDDICFMDIDFGILTILKALWENTKSHAYESLVDVDFLHFYFLIFKNFRLYAFKGDKSTNKIQKEFVSYIQQYTIFGEDRIGVEDLPPKEYNDHLEYLSIQ